MSIGSAGKASISFRGSEDYRWMIQSEAQRRHMKVQSFLEAAVAHYMTKDPAGGRRRGTEGPLEGAIDGFLEDEGGAQSEDLRIFLRHCLTTYINANKPEASELDRRMYEMALILVGLPAPKRNGQTPK